MKGNPFCAQTQSILRDFFPPRVSRLGLFIGLPSLMNINVSVSRDNFDIYCFEKADQCVSDYQFSTVLVFWVFFPHLPFNSCLEEYLCELLIRKEWDLQDNPLTPAKG